MKQRHFSSAYFKKIRNNLLKNNSNNEKSSRKLQVNGQLLTFQQLKDYTNHSIKKHQKLGPHHFELDGRSKMRNHLAKDVLEHVQSDEGATFQIYTVTLRLLKNVFSNM